MKTLCLLLAIAFLVFQIQATPAPPPEKAARAPEPSDYQEDDHRLKKNSALSSRLTTFSCFGPFGYCLPREWQCLSEYVFHEDLNDCPLDNMFKCCVL